MRNKFIYLSCFLVLVILFLGNGVFSQCAMCKAVVESVGDDGSLPIGKGLNKGILYLMGIPYVLLFFLFRKKLKTFYREFFQVS